MTKSTRQTQGKAGGHIPGPTAPAGTTCALSTHQAIADADGRQATLKLWVLHLPKQVAGLDMGPDVRATQAAAPARLTHETRSQEVRVGSQVEAQLAPAVLKLVEGGHIPARRHIPLAQRAGPQIIGQEGASSVHAHWVYDVHRRPAFGCTPCREKTQAGLRSGADPGSWLVTRD